MTITNLPTPSQLLGVGNLSTWYPGQYDLLQQSLSWYYSPSRFLGLSIPTGAGKSLGALLLSKLSGARTIILTATKGLQVQYQKDSSLIGGVSVVGQNNFSCVLVSGLTADEGPCHEGLPCPVREQCPYRVQLRKALDANLVVTNYSYWLAQTNYSSGLGEFDLAILDEGHQCFSAMENYLTIFLSRIDLQPMGLDFPVIPVVLSSPPATTPAVKRRTKTGAVSPPDGYQTTPDSENGAVAGLDGVQDGGQDSNQDKQDEWSIWQSWAERCQPVADESIAHVELDMREYRNAGKTVPNHVSRAYRSAKSVAAKLERLSSVGEDWVIQKTHHGYRFVPKWVANYGGHLFRDVPKVVLMSAILSHRSCDYLGVPSDGSRTWIEMDSHFPPENTQIWHIPTARINYLTDDFGSTLWVSRIDQIIQRRLDRKGIVFTVSYDRARMLLSRSRFKDIMYAHSTGDVVQVVEKFKQAKPPAVLVSPTVTTGWDFPMDISGHGIPQYAVVGKIPYPDTRDVVTHARSDDDKEWTAFLAMETFVQECGRLSRRPTDLAEIFVTDDVFKWWYWKHKQFAPKWFQERVRGSLNTVPDPLV